jgi:beta-glucanase (GH16 family)
VTSQEYELTTGSFHDEFHVFAVEWEPGSIRWEVDSIPYFGVTKIPGEDSAYWPFDEGHAFYLLLNLAVGGWFDAPNEPPPDMQPQRLYVDYVRVYQRSEN